MTVLVSYLKVKQFTSRSGGVQTQKNQRHTPELRVAQKSIYNMENLQRNMMLTMTMVTVASIY
jgi:hypothetical protein